MEGCCPPRKGEPLLWGSTLVEVLGEEFGRRVCGGVVKQGMLSGLRTPTCLESDPPSVPATADGKENTPAATDGDENTPAPVSCLLSPEGQALVKALFRSSAI